MKLFSYRKLVLIFLLLPNILLASNVADESNSMLHIKDISEFKFKDKKKYGIERGGIYTLKGDDNSQFLVKIIEKENKREHRNGFRDAKKMVIYDVVAAFIIRKIDANRAPVNYVVRLVDGNIAVASKFLKNFVTSDNFHLAPEYKESLFKKEKDMAYHLARFINNYDLSPGNFGFVVEDGKIINSALIDFDHALLCDDNYLCVEYNINKAPTKYHFEIDYAIQNLELISKFDVDSLNELYPLFEQLKEVPLLEEIKCFMREQLADVKARIKACKIVKKIISNNFNLEEFNQLVRLNISLNDFGIEFGENVLMNALYRRRDVSLIAKVLCRKESIYVIDFWGLSGVVLDSVLIIDFVIYCIKNREYGLLRAVVVSLKPDKLSCDILSVFLSKSQTIEQLKISMELIKGLKEQTDMSSLTPEGFKCFNSLYFKIYDLIKDFLSSVYNIDELFEVSENYILSNNNELYYHILHKIIIFWAVTNSTNVASDIPLTVKRNIIRDLSRKGELKDMDIHIGTIMDGDQDKVDDMVMLLVEELIHDAKEKTSQCDCL